MKAGAALGLLAGLGALNALGGGRNGTGKRFTGLMDMLDGGGAGASGDKFEGGGLLSMLGNLFAKPLEAQDNVERIAADTNATRAVTKTLEDMAKGGTLTSRLDGKDGMPTVGPSGPPMPATAFSPVMPNQPLPTYDEVTEQRLPTYTEAPTSRGGQRGGLLDYSGPTSRGGRRGDRPMVYSGRSDVGMPDVGPVYSGRGISVGGFSPSLYASMVDDLIATGMGDFVDTADQATMMDLYSTYVQNGGNLY